MTAPAPATPPARRGFLASGGYVFILAAVAAVIVFAWGIQPILRGAGSRAIGDGSDPASYGFSLDPLLVSREFLAAAGFPKDGVRALVDPPRLDPALANDKEALGVLRGKYVVPGQRVIGVAIGGEARAYPLRLLNWHEVINDTVGGVPIAVTYNPLADAALVFDRRVGGETLEFHVSGLLWSSNLLLFDRRADPAQESLWSQLQSRAIAGPAAARGDSLVLVTSVLDHWNAWLEAHPETTLVKPEPQMLKQYRRDPYGAYFGDDRLRFPVAALPPESSGLGLKDRVVAIRAGDAWWVVPYPDLAARVSAEPGVETTLTSTLGGVPVALTYRAAEPVVVARRADTGEPLPTIHALWFAWFAHHTGSDGMFEVVRFPAGK